MKRVLTSILVMLSLVSFASPSNDKFKVEIVKKVDWTQPSQSLFDPMITDFSISIINYGLQRYLNIDYYTDFSVNYAQKLELRVYGSWYSMGGWDFKPFVVRIGSGMIHGWENFLLHPQDQPWPESYVWDYFGPY